MTGTINLQATANDASGIQKVDYHLDSAGGPVIGTSSLGPNYTASWDTTTVPLGAHTIYAVATDNATNPGTSSPVNVTVTDSAPPTVSMALPLPGPVSGNVTVSGNRISACAFSGIRNNSGANCQIIGNMISDCENLKSPNSWSGNGAPLTTIYMS